MALVLLLLSSVHAAAPSAGYFLAGAGAVEEGVHGALGVTAGGIGVCTEGCGGGPYALGTAWAVFGKENRFAGQIQGLWIGGTTAEGGDPFFVGASVRYNAVQEDDLSVAPWVGVLSDPLRRAFSADTREVYAVGLAVEYGGERVRLDASTPLLAFPQDEPGRYLGDPQFLLAADIAVAEVGLRVGLGKGHTLRFAKEAILPVVTWRWEGPEVWVEAGGGVWLIFNEVHAGMGVRF